MLTQPDTILHRMSCRFEILSYDADHGYVVHCNSCNALQLAFGCILFTFSREEFLGFNDVVNYHLAQDPGDICPNLKSINIRTPCEGLSLCLSKSDLVYLSRLVDTAETQLRANELLELFNKQ